MDLKGAIDQRVRQATRHRRALPDFLIIGAEKSGSTSLRRWLATHPDVEPPRPRGEVHYFDQHYERGDDWYRSNFPRRSHLSRRQRRTGRRVVTGEKSPIYLFHPLVPERAARTVPQAKLIAVLREPVARAVSHHGMATARGLESLPLGEAINAEDERIDEAFRRAGEGEPVPVDSPLVWFSYVRRGQYIDQLERWWAHYPRDQLLTVRAEDLWADSDDAAKRVLEFLELDASVCPPMLHRAKGKNKDEREPLPDAVRAELGPRFEDSNRRLAEATGIRWD